MTNFLHSRYTLMVGALLSVLLAWLYYAFGQAVYPATDGGLVSGWDVQWIASKGINALAGIVLSLGIAILVGYINRKYVVLRSMTWLQSTWFLVFELATPSLMLYLYPGALLALVVVACFYLMYSSFDSKRAQRSVYTVFLLLSGCSAFDYAFLVYLPVFMFGTAQMRILSLRTVLAALMGLATPWIIYLGFGLVPLESLQWPHVYAADEMQDASVLPWMVSVGAFTAFLGIGAWVQSAMKIMKYNAQSRGMLNMLSVALLFTIVAQASDYSHVWAFLPMLNCLTALMLTHVFGVVYRQKKSYIAILSIMGIYLILYIWRLAICISL